MGANRWIAIFDIENCNCNYVVSTRCAQIMRYVLTWLGSKFGIADTAIYGRKL